MRYKPCCDRRCAVFGCEARDAGACYCVCRLIDEINNLKSVIKGVTVNWGCVYVPDKDKREAWYCSLSNEQREYEDRFRMIIAPERLLVLEERLSALTETDL
jgi:hypothetical protein